MVQVKYRQPAFTFLELLMALSLFTIGMLSVLQVFPVNRRLLQQTANTTQATFIAQEVIEQARLQPFDSLTLGTYLTRAAVTADTSNPLHVYERQVDVVQVQNNLKRIDVTIYWNENGVARQYVLSTYVNGI